jgi:hypothetical protein
LVVAAVLVLLSGCARPQGAQATPTPTPSPTPVAQHAPLTVASPVFHSGEIGVVYAPVKLSATGGVAPYTWSVSVGALPGGLALSTDGIVSGTPTQNGYFTFSVQVFDAGNNDTAGLPTNIPIVPRLIASLVPACATECTVELGCVTVCGTFGQVSGGVAPLTYKLTVGVLPAGTALSGLSLNGTFIGLPGRLQFTVQVTDGFGVVATIAPRYNLIPHISFPGGQVGGSGVNTCPWPGCSQQLPYSGGTGAPKVKVTGWSVSSRYCDPGYPCTPAPTPTASVGGNLVTINVPGPGRAYGGGYQGTLLLTLTDQSLCGASTYCSTTGTVTVIVATS